MNRAQIDAGFEEIRTRRFLRSHVDDLHDPDFWRALNPELTISDHPFARPRARRAVDPRTVERAAGQIVDEGYFQTPPLLADEEMRPLRSAIERVVGAGFPPGLACVYDEFYRAFQGLDDLMAPLVGDGYLMVLQGLWAFFVPPGDSAYGRLSAQSPHRDVLGPDPAVLARGLPTILAVWIPLTDVTPMESCIYVLPADCDPDYYSPDQRGVRPERLRLQDVRALPARAGSVLGWSTHAVHWGSRSSRFGGGPRIAIAVYVQRADVPHRHPFTVDFQARMPFDDRLGWIEDSYGIAGLFARG